MHPLNSIRAKASKLYRYVRQSIRPKPNPPTDYEAVQQAYVEGALTKIRSGAAHASLGANIDEESNLRAIKTAQLLISLPIQKDDVVVDYGCGTLRIGKHLIEHLDPNRYVGMDINEEILAAGLDLLDKRAISIKQPILKKISQESISSIAQLSPKFIFAKGVLQHVPPSGIDQFFINIADIANLNTLILIRAKTSEKTARLSERSWIHSRQTITSSALKAGLAWLETTKSWYIFHLNR